MKTQILLLTTLFANLTACGNLQIEEEKPLPEISINPKTLIFSSDGGKQSVIITSNYDWELEDSENSWCKPSVKYGSDNETTVTFTVASFLETQKDRNATFTFICHDNSDNTDEMTLTVTQIAKEYSISLDHTELIFDVTGGKTEIIVTSSDEWELSEYPEWCKPSITEGKNGDTIELLFNSNNTSEKRKATIIFTCGNKTAELSVNQEADSSPIIKFKDPLFLQALLQLDGIDKNEDNQISEEEAACVRALNIDGKTIQNIDEVRYFTSLTYLKCDDNVLTSLDLSGCTTLEHLHCNNNKLTNLNLSECNALKYVFCFDNKLTTLDLSGRETLKQLCCEDNKLTSLNLSGCIALEHLRFFGNQLTTLDVSGCSSLESLDYSLNELTTLNVRGCTALESLNCSSNELTSLDVSGCTALEDLSCESNKLTNLDLRECIALESLDCSHNILTSLDISGCTTLEHLDCDNNKLTNLDVSQNTALTSLSCACNKLTNLDLNGCTTLEILYCYDNQLFILDLNGCTTFTTLACSANKLTSLDVSGCIALKDLSCASNQLTILDVSKNIALEDLSCYDNPLEKIYLNINNNLPSSTIDMYHGIIEYVK